MIKASSLTLLSLLNLVALSLVALHAQARTVRLTPQEDQESPVIPSPSYADQENLDIEREGAALESQQAAASEPTGVPVYVSPFLRAERTGNGALNFDHQESSHAPPNYAPRPLALSPSSASAASMPAPSSSDLKTSASYGHHHHGGHHGYDHGGWLDMGAWTGGKGSFGWYADYPVGGKHHGYGKRR